MISDQKLRKIVEDHPNYEIAHATHERFYLVIDSEKFISIPSGKTPQLIPKNYIIRRFDSYDSIQHGGINNENLRMVLRKLLDLRVERNKLKVISDETLYDIITKNPDFKIVNTRHQNYFAIQLNDVFVLLPTGESVLDLRNYIPINIDTSHHITNLVAHPVVKNVLLRIIKIKDEIKNKVEMKKDVVMVLTNYLEKLETSENKKEEDSYESESEFDTSNPLCGMYKYPDGHCFRDSNLRFHNPNGPAIVTPTNHEYFIHGIRHRDGGPAQIRFNEKGEIKEYYYFSNGKIHREDGPAVKIGDTFYHYKNGLRHREDGPAFYEVGCHKYYLNDRLIKTVTQNGETIE